MCEHVFNSMLRYSNVRYFVLHSDQHCMSCRQLLYVLIRFVADLTKGNRQTKATSIISNKLKRLDKDVAAANQESTEQALKRAKHDFPIKFKRKGHQEQ